MKWIIIENKLHMPFSQNLLIKNAISFHFFLYLQKLFETH